MGEIEELYSKAGLVYCNKCRHDSELDCIYMCESKHPPFTAEKQLELIKWLANNKLGLGIDYFGKWSIGVEFEWEIYKHTKENEIFEEALASLINSIWQDFTEEQKKQIVEILKWK